MRSNQIMIFCFHFIFLFYFSVCVPFSFFKSIVFCFLFLFFNQHEKVSHSVCRAQLPFGLALLHSAYDRIERLSVSSFALHHLSSARTVSRSSFCQRFQSTGRSLFVRLERWPYSFASLANQLFVFVRCFGISRSNQHNAIECLAFVLSSLVRSLQFALRCFASTVCDEQSPSSICLLALGLVWICTSSSHSDWTYHFR